MGRRDAGALLRASTRGREAGIVAEMELRARGNGGGCGAAARKEGAGKKTGVRRRILIRRCGGVEWRGVFLAVRFKSDGEGGWGERGAGVGGVGRMGRRRGGDRLDLGDSAQKG